MQRPDDGYKWDVFVSYPRQGTVEGWVRKHLVPLLKKALQENLARESLFIDQERLNTGVSWPKALEHELRRSRVLLAVTSRQYFKKAWCLAELESMMRRSELLGMGTDNNPQLLVHAIVIVAHDCVEPERIPESYKHIFLLPFAEHAYPFPDTEFAAYKAYYDAVLALAERLANSVNSAPPWRPDFPIVRPNEGPPDSPALPRL